MNIAIFGGSFNPPHADHERLLQWLVNSSPLPLTKILVVVVGDEHALGKGLAPSRSLLADEPGSPLQGVYVVGTSGLVTRTGF